MVRQGLDAHCYCTAGSATFDEYTSEFRHHCARFYSVSPSTTSAKKAAEMINVAGVHVLIDLNGWSEGARWDVINMRPSPVIVSYLGFVGTTGSPSVDYALGDAVVFPPDYAQHMSEHIVYHPSVHVAHPHFFDMNAMKRDCTEHAEVAPSHRGGEKGREEVKVGSYNRLNKHSRRRIETIAHIATNTNAKMVMYRYEHLSSCSFSLSLSLSCFLPLALPFSPYPPSSSSLLHLLPHSSPFTSRPSPSLPPFAFVCYLLSHSCFPLCSFFTLAGVQLLRACICAPARTRAQVGTQSTACPV